MKTMVVWTPKASVLREAVARFLSGQVTEPQGVTLVDRWHSVDLSIGFNLYEFTDAASMYAVAAAWADLLELHTYIVVHDAEVGPILTHTFGAQQQIPAEPVPA